MDDLKGFDIDVIVGSDLVYDMKILPALASVIRNLLDNNKLRNTSAYIACTQRKQTSIDTFLQKIKDEGLQYNVILRRSFSPRDCIMVNHEALHNITIYKIGLNVP